MFLDLNLLPQHKRELLIIKNILIQFYISSAANDGPLKHAYLNFPSNYSFNIYEINYPLLSMIPFEHETKGILVSKYYLLVIMKFSNSYVGIQLNI